MKVSAGGDWIGCLSALLRTPPRYKQAGETVRKEAGADQTTDIASSSAPSDGVADVFRIDFNSSFYMVAGSSNDYLLIFLSLSILMFLYQVNVKMARLPNSLDARQPPPSQKGKALRNGSSSINRLVLSMSH